MLIKKNILILLLVMVSFFSPALLACPICHTQTGELVRAGITTDFWQTFFKLSLPFIIFAYLSIHF